MLNMGGGEQWEGWRLIGSNASSPGERELVFDNGITWRVPVLAGDCKTPDSWYPNMLQWQKREFAKPKHVSKLTILPPNRNQPDPN